MIIASDESKAFGISTSQFCPGIRFSASSHGWTPRRFSVRYSSRTFGLSAGAWQRNTLRGRFISDIWFPAEMGKRNYTTDSLIIHIQSIAVYLQRVASMRARKKKFQ
jgi:hypothetical protein